MAKYHTGKAHFINTYETAYVELNSSNFVPLYDHN